MEPDSVRDKGIQNTTKENTNPITNKKTDTFSLKGIDFFVSW